MRFLLCFVGLWFSCAHAFDQDPSPRFEPLDVLEIVLAGMAANDFPERDAGLRQAFRFASPGNKAAVGPFWHFKAVVNQPDYAPLLNHIERVIGDPLVSEATSASIPVIVTSGNGEIAGFMWRLSLQTNGEYKGSWMTDAVYRVALGEDLKAL